MERFSRGQRSGDRPGPTRLWKSVKERGSSVEFREAVNPKARVRSNLMFNQQIEEKEAEKSEGPWPRDMWSLLDVYQAAQHDKTADKQTKTLLWNIWLEPVEVVKNTSSMISTFIKVITGLFWFCLLHFCNISSPNEKLDDGTMMKWLALLPHSRKVVCLIPT